MSCIAALAALGGFSSKISDEKADAFCKSLEKKSPELLEKMTLLFEKHKKRNTFDDTSFPRYVVDLLYEQTKNSLAHGRFAGHFIDICDPIRGCKCCDSFNMTVREHSFSQARKEIDKMLEDPSNSFELFHEFAKLAVQNEVERQEALMTQSLRVAAALPVPAATTFPVAAAAFPPSKDDEDCAMYD
jgi:hypothetical protein